jgi:hypothetical protein
MDLEMLDERNVSLPEMATWEIYSLLYLLSLVSIIFGTGAAFSSNLPFGLLATIILKVVPLSHTDTIPSASAIF